MLPTPEEKKRIAQEKARQEFAQKAKVRAAGGMVANPLYGQSQFEPESSLSTVPSDPELAKPLPSGRYIDPRIPSQLNATRLLSTQEARKDMPKYIEENNLYLNDEESLMDKGKSVLGRIFDYRDEADAQLFGVDLGAAESAWDGFLRYFTGAYDLLNVGMGGLISAAPGGVETLSFEQLSGGKDVGEILSGEMEPGSAPSPGQIAIASIAKESKRIREGKARLSDVLLMNPATAPFILAGIAAGDSPLQADDFDIMDKEQRDKAFGSGWEQWMSGVTDAGLMFADPLIGIGVAAKIGRAGLLGARGSLKTADEGSAAIAAAMDNVFMPAFGTQTFQEATEQMRALANARRQKIAQGGDALKEIRETGQVTPLQGLEGYTPRRVTEDMPRPESNNPYEGVIYDVTVVDAEGKAKMSVREIEKIPEIAALTNRGDVADLLYRNNDPVVAAYIFDALQGGRNALRNLMDMSPAIGDEVLRANREYIGMLSRTGEPQKLLESQQYLNRSIENLRSQRDFIDEKMRSLAPDGNIASVAPEKKAQFLELEQNGKVLDNSIGEAAELYDVIVNGRQIDTLDYTSAFYNVDKAKTLLDDLLSQEDVVSAALRKNIYEAAVEAKVMFPTRNNVYSRTVIASRERRRKGAYQYATEGTSILPKKVLVSNTDGNLVYQSDGWFTASQFEGTSRLRRASRVWRWAGTETPSGFIGLKGTATVGSEREFNAALNLDLYNGNGVTVMRPSAADPNVMEPVVIGGRENRDKLFAEFYEALNSPDLDAFDALMEVERKVADDFAAAYGVDPQNLQNVLKRGNVLRTQHMKSIQENGYFVTEDGVVHHAPWLEVHGANGTYMQNFQEIEKVLRRETKKGSIAEFNRKMEIPAHLAASGYNLFNNFWRPLTLMRLSYTQRNIMEGMFRAMAYSASLAPLSWPVKATAFGVRNAAVKRVVDRQVKKAYKAVDDSEFGPMFRDANDAESEFTRLSSAFFTTGPNDVEQMAYVNRRGITPKGESPYEQLTIADYEARLTATQDRLAAARGSLEQRAEAFTQAVEGTAFGKWRKQQLAAMDTAIEEHKALVDSLEEIIAMPNADGVALTFGDPDFDTAFRQLAEVANLGEVLVNKKNALLYDPSRAIGEYRGIAGRQKRIGSGTSIGPDGNYFNDAFTGPLEQINRGQMSADNTVKQALSLSSNIWQSQFTRIMVRNNQPIQLILGNEKQFFDGMRGVIDQMASSSLIRRLVDSGFDQEDAVAWLTSPGAGQDYLKKLRLTWGDASLADAPDDPSLVIRKPGQEVQDARRIKPLTKTERTASGESIEITDVEQVRLYVNEVASRVVKQTQGREEFMNLLRRRISEKQVSAGVSDDVTRAGGITVEDVEAAFNSMPPDVRQSMYGKYTMGDEIIHLGADGVLNMWSGFANSMFKFLGTIPEDAITRGGFYNMRFKTTRDALVRSYWERSGADLKVVGKANKEFWKSQKKAKGSANQPQGMTIEHPPFNIPARELSRIEVMAHRRALMDTREWMYTIERRTNLGKYGEWIYPFISAQQNSVVTMGKLLYKEPWLAPALIDLWRMPTRLGIEDEDGNISMPMPLEWFREALKDNPDIPILGGVVDSMDQITLPKNGLNVIMPESGFGLAPRPTPWIQVGASEMMKANFFPVETPQLLKNILGDQAGDEFYTSLKEYMFGEEGSVSSTLFSLDKITPAYIQKFIQSKSELSAQYGYQYVLQWHTQTMRWRAGERDTAPDENEINKRTTNMLLFGLAGNVGIPTPLTPYPIVTRPQVANPASLLADIYQVYKEKDPLNASLNFSNSFGDWALEAANTKVTQNVGGANASATTVSDIKTLDGLIREVVPLVGDDLGVLGILINNRSSMVDYEASAYQWQKSGTIAGTNRQWREVQAPGEANAERQRLTGWTVYRQFMDQLDARLQNAGFTSYEVAGAAEYKQAKQVFVQNMSSNPDFQGWLIDFQDRGGARTNAAVRTMEKAIGDADFQKLMFEGGKEGTYAAMTDYVRFRAGIIQALEATGKSIEHDDNYQFKIAWANIRQTLKNRDVRFAEIMDLYLSNDDNPQFPGTIVDMNQPLPMMQGVPNG